MILKFENNCGWVFIDGIKRIDYENKLCSLWSAEELIKCKMLGDTILSNYYLVDGKKHIIEIAPEQFVNDYNYLPYNVVVLEFFVNERDKRILFNGNVFIYNDSGVVTEVIKNVRTIYMEDLPEKVKK